MYNTLYKIQILQKDILYLIVSMQEVHLAVTHIHYIKHHLIYLINQIQIMVILNIQMNFMIFIITIILI